jgi:hypothetical protein
MTDNSHNTTMGRQSKQNVRLGVEEVSAIASFRVAAGLVSIAGHQDPRLRSSLRPPFFRLSAVSAANLSQRRLLRPVTTTLTRCNPFRYVVRAGSLQFGIFEPSYEVHSSDSLTSSPSYCPKTMSAPSPQLLGSVIRLVKRELDGWKASSAPGVSAGAGGSTFSTNGDGAAEARAALDKELQKLFDCGLSRKEKEEQTVAALLAGVKVLFKGLCDAMTLSSVAPSVVAGSATVAALHLLQKAISLSMEGLKAAPCEAIEAALPAIKRGSGKESADRMVSLLKYFLDEVCEKAWGVDDAWGDHDVRGEQLRSPLEMIAGAGNVTLASTVLQKAKKVDVARGACHAFYCICPDVFDTLIEDERCLTTGAAPFISLLLRHFLEYAIHIDTYAEAQIKAQQRLMIERALRKWPQTATDRWVNKDALRVMSPLMIAVQKRDTQLTKLILEVAPDSICYEQKEETVQGRKGKTLPSLFFALHYPCVGVMRTLIDAGALAAGKYQPSALVNLCEARALFSACAFPLKPQFEEQCKHMTVHRRDIQELMDLVLTAPFPAFVSGYNPFLGVLSDFGECTMEEQHAISYLLKCKAAGMDIIHVDDPEAVKPNACTLVHLAAEAGYNKLVDLAIELQGPESVESWVGKQGPDSGKIIYTPLTMALRAKKFETALHLLRRHKAKAAYKGDLPHGVVQPLVSALTLRDDGAAVPVVKQLISQDPSLCDSSSYKNAATIATTIHKCASYNLPRCLEALLSANLPGVEQLSMLEQRLDALVGGDRWATMTPAQLAAGTGHWETLQILLQRFPEISVTSHGSETRSDGTFIRHVPTVEESVKAKGAPRSILLQVEAMARRQKAEIQKAAVVATNSAVPSNAFEDPTKKVLTESEEKKKAKKREQKKEAKARKRAAAAASTEGNAGAGKEVDIAVDSDSDSSGSDDEEAGMNEEERMLARAPTFDLEKEIAARKARAEAEARARAGEKSEEGKE